MLISPQIRGDVVNTCHKEHDTMPIDIEPNPESEHSLGNKKKEREELRALADMIATFLDSAFVLPGTNIRIGLDPLLGLIPGIGDLIANLIGSSILFMATQLGVPRIVIFRMALNIFLNMLLGVVPGIGDLFSFWFKSNVRNATLLRRYCQPLPPASTALDWIYVISLVVIVLATLVGILIAFLWLIKKIWQLTG